MTANQTKTRPVIRNLGLREITIGYRLPLPGRLSILHRVSGAILFLALPVIFIPIFALSVQSPSSFAALGSGFGGFILKLILLVLLWGFMHHLCAGIRYLVLDIGLGLDKASARKSALAVFIVSLSLTLIFAIKLFGVLS